MPAVSGAEASLADIMVRIEDAARCPRYTAAVLDVQVGPSPAWMAARLQALGMRSINNVVDVTNYVMAEVGQPMHAFDLTRLADRSLRIRCAAAGERVVTLDGQTRTLSAEMLVIADAARPQAVGGVMGGAASEVSASTTTIVLESAYFDPRSVRRTGKRLGLSTEASYRFERGVDPNLAARASLRACALLEQMGAGRKRPGFIDCYPRPLGGATVALRAARLERMLGAPVPDGDSSRILTRLGFTPTLTGPGTWDVGVPSWRGDVTREIDLVEEVARHYGYEKLPASFPALDAAPPRPLARLERDRLVRRLAAAAGFSESVTFSFIERAAAAAFSDGNDIVAIANPLSELFAVLRPSLLPGLLDSLAHNRRRGRRDVRLFELGSAFSTARGETRRVGLAWTGSASVEHWSGSGRLADFYDMKGVIEHLALHLGLVLDYEATEVAALEVGRSAAIVLCGPEGTRTAVGIMGQLAPALTTVRDIPGHEPVFVAELDLDLVDIAIRLPGIFDVVSLPRFPGVVRDIALVVRHDLPAREIHGTIRRAAPSTLTDVKAFDRYRGPNVGEGLVSLAFHLTFQATDRTLTDAEVQQAMDAIVQALRSEHEARLR
jgi:phenylalanyl-tRNA synthetase beta chain